MHDMPAVSVMDSTIINDYTTLPYMYCYFASTLNIKVDHTFCTSIMNTSAQSLPDQ